MKSFLIILLCISSFFATAQNNNVAINNDGSLPASSAILDVNAPDKGILIPRTDTASVLLPVKGLMIFDTLKNAFAYYAGTNWAFVLDDVHSTFYYYDMDGDGYGVSSNVVYAPFAPSGFVSLDGDCNDTLNMVNPAAVEICDGMDNDCDEMIDEGDACVPIVINSIDAPYGNTNLNSPHVISVTGLDSSRTPVTVELIESATIYNIPFQWDAGSSGIIDFTLPNGLTAGLYDVKITASNMNTSTMVDGLQLVDVLTIILTQITPDVVQNTSSFPIQIECDDSLDPSFQDTPWAYIESNSTGDVYALENELFLGTNSIRAYVPSSLPIGIYTVWVINPDGTTGLLPSALEIE